jgi:hypothetical protein
MKVCISKELKLIKIKENNVESKGLEITRV